VLRAKVTTPVSRLQGGLCAAAARSPGSSAELLVVDAGMSGRGTRGKWCDEVDDDDAVGDSVRGAADETRRRRRR
jgi:hypothetical protein